MKKITVLGGGMVGSAISVDLCLEYQVLVADLNSERLAKIKAKHLLETAAVDLNDENKLLKIIDKADLVINAVPGFMGFNILKKIIETGKNVVDISFFDEDPLLLDEMAKEKNITAVVDCGVAPGLSNIILGYYSKKMNVENYECRVGGLPFKRKWPFQYKAPFSPVDVIEEYTRPARMVINGQQVLMDALTDIEYVNIDPIGSLEAFNTDGLRTLLQTMKIPNMKEKTLRYPGHAEYISVLRETGFFGKEPVILDGINVKPIDLTKELIFPLWKLDEGEREFTAMEILIRGTEGNQKKEYRYSLFDKFDEKSNTTSMARTTGYTCTSAARLVIEEKFSRKGICPPEYIGMQEGCFVEIQKMLEERNIKAKLKVNTLV